MSVRAKWAIVLGGYAAAFAAAALTVAWRLQHVNGPVAQASSGMYAFGDTVLMAGVFGLVASVPTALGLWFVRPVPRFWTALAAVAIGLAACSAAAAGLVGASAAVPSLARTAFAAYAFLFVLASPALGAAFALAGMIAPGGKPRHWLLGAAAVELVLCAAAVLWLVTRRGD